MSGIRRDIDDIEGGEIPRDGNYCLNLVIITNLASVDADVLSKTQKGDILLVIAQTQDGPVVVLKDDTVLGTILSSHLMQLLDCMNKGTEYEAIVLKIEDAICQVKVSAVK